MDSLMRRPPCHRCHYRYYYYHARPLPPPPTPPPPVIAEPNPSGSHDGAGGTPVMGSRAALTAAGACACRANHADASGLDPPSAPPEATVARAAMNPARFA